MQNVCEEDGHIEALQNGQDPDSIDFDEVNRWSRDEHAQLILGLVESILLLVIEYGVLEKHQLA